MKKEKPPVEEPNFNIAPENKVRPLTKEEAAAKPKPYQYPEKEEPVKGKKKKSGLKKWTLAIGILSAILAGVALSYYLIPALGGVIGAVLTLLFGVILAILSLITLFFIWTNEGARQTVGKIWEFIQWFFNINEHISKLEPYFPYVAFASMGLSFVCIVLSIIGISKQKERGFLPWLFVCLAFLLLISVLLIIYYTSGGHVLSPELASSLV